MTTPSIERCRQFIAEALECAVYLRPAAPGLTTPELSDLAPRLGYKPGVLNDALSHMDGVLYTDGRLEFRPGSAGIFTTFLMPLNPDYRDFKALDAIVQHLRDLADEHALARASASQDALIACGTEAGISAHNMAVAFQVLRLGEVLVTGKDGQWRLSPAALSAPLLPSAERAQLTEMPQPIIRQREGFASVYEGLQAVFASARPSVTTSTSKTIQTASLAQGKATMATPDPSKVFVIHGRNEDARREMGAFLRSLGLKPLWFEEVRAQMGGMTHPLQTVRRGMDQAKGVLALFTPDEFSSLHPILTGGATGETVERWQARPNVLFEAGLACGLNPDQVAFVLFGDVKLFTDVTGIHVFRPTKDVSATSHRTQLKDLLGQGMGCAVDPTSHDWMHSGNFEAVTAKLSGVSTRSPFPMP